MEKENPTLIKDNRYENQFDGYGDDWNAGPVKEISNRAAEQWPEDEQIDNAVPLDLEAEKELPEKAETESDSEGNLEKKLNKGTESSSVNSVPAEILQQFGDGPWNKTYTEQGVATFDFQTGEMMSADGSISLTQQIRDNASGEHAALHEQVIAGWQASSGDAQLIAFNEIAENGTVVHVTKTWVGSDGQIFSETWSKELPKEEPPADSPDLIDTEPLIGDDNDDSLSNQNISIDHDSINLKAESTAGNREAVQTGVMTRKIQPEARGIELPKTNDSDGDSNATVKASVQEKASLTPDQSLPLDEPSSTLEPTVDLTSAVETANDDDAVPPRENHHPDVIARTTETMPPDPDQKISIPPPQSPVTEPRPRFTEQSNSEDLTSEIASSASALEKSSTAEDYSALDNDFEAIPAAADNETLQLETESTVEDSTRPANVAAIETGESATGIEIMGLTDNISDLTKIPELITTEEMPLKAATENRQILNESPEDTGITLLADTTIAHVRSEIKSSPADNKASSMSGLAKELVESNETSATTSFEVLNPATIEPNSEQILPSPNVKQDANTQREQPRLTLKQRPMSAGQISRTDKLPPESISLQETLINSNVVEERIAVAELTEPTFPAIKEIYELTGQKEPEADVAAEADGITLVDTEEADAKENFGIRTPPVEPEFDAKGLAYSAAHKIEETNLNLEIETAKQSELIDKTRGQPRAGPIAETKTIDASEQANTQTALRVEQNSDPAEVKASSFGLKKTSPLVSKRQSAKPIIVKLTKKTPLPFRPAELVNRILTYQPTTITDDEAITNEPERSPLPEFELAA